MNLKSFRDSDIRSLIFPVRNSKWGGMFKNSYYVIELQTTATSYGDISDLKKRLNRSFIVEAKNCSGGHLTKTQKAAGPSDQSLRNHPAWIIKCKFKDF